MGDETTNERTPAASHVGLFAYLLSVLGGYVSSSAAAPTPSGVFHVVPAVNVCFSKEMVDGKRRS